MESPPQSVTELCQALVRIPSVNPDGDPGVAETGEAACAEYVGGFLRHCGANVVLGDGSVRLISSTINIREYAKLVTRAEREAAVLP